MRCENHDTERDLVTATLRFDRDELTVTESPSGLLLELQGMKSAGTPGAPALPRTQVRLAVPEGTWPHELVIESATWEPVLDSGTFVAAVQHLSPGGEDKGQDKGQEGGQCSSDCTCRVPADIRTPLTEGLPTRPIALPDEEAYLRAARDPEPPAHAVGVETAGTTNVAVIGISPVRLNEKGGLELCTELTVSVKVSREMPLGNKELAVAALREQLGRDIDPARVQPRPSMKVTGAREARRLHDLVASSVLNPKLVSRIDIEGILLRLPSEYLVITDDRQWDAATITPGAATPGMVAAFQRLAQAKRARGITARVVTITDIVNGRYGDFRSGARDLPEVIRSFLKDVRHRWGVSWLLLGGDVGVVPARQVAGAFEGHVSPGSSSTPDDNTSYWTGSFLKMKVVNPGTWWNNSTMNQLVRPDTGLRIPYDATGSSSLCWYFTTSNWSTPSATPTQYVRVNGSAAQVNTTLQFLYTWNTLPTDFYYASLASWVIAKRTIDLGWFTFEIPYVTEPAHDWDALENGIYGQHHVDGTDLDGVHLATDLSVGRAPVQSATEAATFVDKVLAYERLDGGVWFSADRDWPTRMVIASSDWGGPCSFTSTTNATPADWQYRHSPGASSTLLKLAAAPDTTARKLVAHVSDSDRRILPMTNGSNATARGWHYVVSATDHSVSEFHFSLPWFLDIRIPIPTQWIVVHGPAAELAPAVYQLDLVAQDGSMADQERLRKQIGSELPAINDISRLYEDELDLTLAERFAGPVQYLTQDRLRTALDLGPHLVSLSGHGNSGGCCGGSVGLARLLRNGKPGFIAYADSCLTNQFDDNDAFSEELLINPDGGAVAYIGNTRFSWIGVGDDFQRAFFHRLTSTRHLGLLNDSKVGLFGSTGYWSGYERWAIFTLNLLGDPEMAVYRTRLRGLVVGLDLSRLVVDLRLVDERPPFPPQPDPELAGILVHVRSGEREHFGFSDAAGQVYLPDEFADAEHVEVTASREDLRTSYASLNRPVIERFKDGVRSPALPRETPQDQSVVVPAQRADESEVRVRQES